jgi:hypothetical protein
MVQDLLQDLLKACIEASECESSMMNFRSVQKAGLIVPAKPGTTE